MSKKKPLHLPVFDLEVKVFDVAPLEGGREYLLSLQVDCDAFEDGSCVRLKKVVTVFGVHRDSVEPAHAEML